MRPGPPKGSRTRICKNGHDKDVTGRSNRGACLVCDQASSVRRKQRTQAARETLAAQVAAQERFDFEPVLRAVEHMPKRVEVAHSTNQWGHVKTLTYERSGISQLGQMHAERFGGNPLSAERTILRAKRRGWVGLDMADRLAVVLEKHPSELWETW